MRFRGRCLSLWVLAGARVLRDASPEALPVSTINLRGRSCRGVGETSPMRVGESGPRSCVIEHVFDMVVGMDGGTTTIMERPAAAGAGGAGGVDLGAVVDGVGDWESRRRELDDRTGVLSAQIHALDAELVGVLAEYDAVGGWQGRGWRSFAHYLSVRTNFAPRDAERLVSIAARVDDMPSLIAAARGGQVSMGVLASAARVVTPENEARVLDVVRACTPRQAQRVLAAYRSLRPTPDNASDSASDGGADDGSVADDLELDHWWRNWIDDHGRYRIDGALDKPTGELREQARRAVIAEMERTGTHPHAD